MGETDFEEANLFSNKPMDIDITALFKKAKIEWVFSRAHSLLNSWFALDWHDCYQSLFVFILCHCQCHGTWVHFFGRTSNLGIHEWLWLCSLFQSCPLRFFAKSQLEPPWTPNTCSLGPMAALSWDRKRKIRHGRMNLHNIRDRGPRPQPVFGIKKCLSPKSKPRWKFSLRECLITA